MLAQVISERTRLRSFSKSIWVYRGTLLFVANKNKFCTVIYEDHIYSVLCATLMFVSSEEEMLSPEELLDALLKRELSWFESVRDQFEKLY